MRMRTSTKETVIVKPSLAKRVRAISNRTNEAKAARALRRSFMAVYYRKIVPAAKRGEFAVDLNPRFACDEQFVFLAASEGFYVRTVNIIDEKDPTAPAQVKYNLYWGEINSDVG